MMKLIFGLGNPNIKYKNTPHNIGRDFLNWLVCEKIKLEWEKREKLKSIIVKSNNNIFAKSILFMNQSGISAKELLNFYNISKNNFFVIQDELDIPWPKIKLSFNRSSAGHKGVKSIIQSINSQNFYRLRIGVAPSRKVKNPDNFLLSKISAEWLEKKEELFEKIYQVLYSKF